MAHAPVDATQSLSIVDMMNVRSAQTLFALGENGALSVGINYMSVGTGTILQPIIMRRLVRQSPRAIQVCNHARQPRGEAMVGEG